MAFRYVVINKKSYLNLKDNNLAVTQNGEEVTVPIEDILSVIVEDNSTTFTSQLMREFIKNNVSVFFCDETHIPVGITLPFLNHGRQFKRLGEQISLEKPFIKRIWQKIIQQKITNQAKCLELLSKDGVDGVALCVGRVNSGDTLNVEGLAARMYFEYLFGKGFTRDIPNGYNAALNYGYTVVRGAVARAIAGYGLIPCLGVKHHNEYNNFNLADDLIEPYRPIVDLWVSLNASEDLWFGTNEKHAIVNLLNHQMIINGQKQSVTNAIEMTVKSFITAMQLNDSNQILLPELINLTVHNYE